MKKQTISEEFKRMQELAGLTEIKVNKPQILKKHPLIDYTAWSIESEDLDNYGDYDEDSHTFEVEGGSDAMADMFNTVYTGDDDWDEDDEAIEALSEFYDFLLEKAIKEKYGDDVNIEYY